MSNACNSLQQRKPSRRASIHDLLRDGGKCGKSPGTRPENRHFPFQHVENLGKFVQSRTAQNLAAGDQLTCRVESPEFEDTKSSFAVSDAVLDKKDRLCRHYF